MTPPLGAASRRPLTWALVGPGVKSIPPDGWGAVEKLIWDYKLRLEALGHEAVVVNTTDRRAVVEAIGRCRPDVVHVHREDLAAAVAATGVPVKIVTSHDPWLLDRRWNPYERLNLLPLLRSGFRYCVLSQAQARKFVASGCSPADVFVTPNGAAHERFRFCADPVHAERSIYLARVCARKRQWRYQTIDSIDFAGPYRNDGNPFDATRKNYLGAWPIDHVYAHLTDYANLVLLSEAEGMPLAVAEAMVCGLGVVVGAACAASLDTSLPWVSVVPDGKLDDLDYVKAEVARNRAVSLRRRAQIRAYGLEHCCWKTLVARYADLCMQLRAGGAAPLPRRRLIHLYVRRHLPALPGKVRRYGIGNACRRLLRGRRPAFGRGA